MKPEQPRTAKNSSEQEHATDEQTAASDVIGIDLSTTNSAVCYVDVSESNWHIRTFAVPQRVAS